MSAWCLVAEGPGIAPTVSLAGQRASARDRAACFAGDFRALLLRVFVPGALPPPAAAVGVVAVGALVAPGACVGAVVAPGVVVAGAAGVVVVAGGTAGEAATVVTVRVIGAGAGPESPASFTSAATRPPSASAATQASATMRGFHPRA